MNTPRKSMIGDLAVRLMVLAAMTSLWAAPLDAQGDSGWSTWQNLGRFYSDPLPNEMPFRLSTAVFFNGNPMIAAVDRGGTRLTVLEGRPGFWIRWYFLNIPAGFYPYVAATTNATPQPIVFYRGRDGVVWFAEVVRQGSGLYGGSVWTEEQSLGRPEDAIPDLMQTMRLSDRRIAICFADKLSSTIRCRIRQAEGAWGAWVSSVQAPEAIGQLLAERMDADHRIHFFAVSSNALLELPQGGRSVMVGAWRVVGRLPPRLRIMAPMAALNGDGRLEVFARGSDQALWHIYQQPGTATGWSSWESLGRPPGTTLPFVLVTDAVAENDDRRLEIFVVAGDGAAWHIYQNEANCCWSGWQSLGRPTWESTSQSLLTELRVVNRRTSGLELFGLDRQGRLWTIYQQ